MSTPSQLILGIVITILILLMAGTIIVLLVAFISQKKNKYEEEKLLMQAKFNEDLLNGKIEIQEHTLNHISKELHDNIAQLLVSLKVQLNLLDKESVLNRSILDEAKLNLTNILTDLRGLAKSLSTDRIRTLDIEALIKKEIEQIRALQIGHFQVNCEGNVRRLDEHKKIMLFRMIQECIQNCVKHSQATEIHATLDYLPAELIVSISDNGLGFDMEEVLKNSDSLGLINLKTRAAQTGGTCSIESSVDNGTIVKIAIPYE